ncbi:efflux RND transporter permease subunit [Aliiroseovarius crassostreae]|uniref:Efflux RND transporter permease subunit n=1 Tax=Aliiroseovarius crassostreae TaxID=154981 RepID=A0A9Q9HD38_9RHOB|nr:efflux RND transporter permease subunit [Aliiroseovarius crassostreae]UWP96327.1 efflux RND transporter permease subunit [Aliiroseovarius crassostreae]
MIGIVDWAATRARMVIAFVILSIAAGTLAYVSLPKEGEPDIEIPALFVSVPFPGISAADSERLLVRTMETELADIDGLKTMSGTAAENYAGIALEFEFGWDKTRVMADVRDAMNTAEGKFPDGYEKYSINEINFSEFPIIIVNLTGPVPERTLIRVAKDLQDQLEAVDAVLEASLAGYRDEMVEVEIDPLRLEAYNVTADELIRVVQSNNQLIAAGDVKTATGSAAIKIPSSFDEIEDIYALPVKVSGDSVVTLGDLASIRLTFEDRRGTARFNGQNSVALQVVKRKGFNLIDTAAQVRDVVAKASAQWPEELQQAVHVGTSNDQSFIVDSMVKQLEGSVITAIALVMIVVLAALGIRSALLVGFAIPTSFLLTFALFGVLDVTISNIVMFGLILAVGMLVDGAIVVVEYADKKISEGVGPMEAYTRAAKRMFWPIVSSTATTLCAFLPMLFWPGIPGQFMGWLPKTLIFVLSASLLVALVYLPVVGGVFGRFERWFQDRVRDIADARFWIHNLLFPIAIGAIILCSYLAQASLTKAMGLLSTMDQTAILSSVVPSLVGAFVLFVAVAGFSALVIGSLLLVIFAISALFKRIRRRLRALKTRLFPKQEAHVEGGHRRTALGYLIHAIAANPVMPLVVIGFIFTLVGTVFIYFTNNNKGVEFFTDSEPEQAIVYVRARGNLSIEEKDAMVRQVERVALGTKGVETVFAFAGEGGLNQNTGGASGPRDSIGQLQLELVAWADRPFIEKDIKLLGFIPFTTVEIDPEYDGDFVMEKLEKRLSQLPGIRFEVLNLNRGPASAKPVHLRLKGDDWTTLRAATQAAVAKFNATPGLTLIEDTLPLPGIDWRMDVDVEKAGRYGTNVATVGGMVQLVTNGILLDTMRVDSSDEEIEIRVRLPEDQRLLSTLDTLKLRTPTGLVPLSNFVTRKPVPSLAQIDRVDQSRYYDVKAGVANDLVKLVDRDGGEQFVTTAEADRALAADPELKRVVVTPAERIDAITNWINATGLPAGVTYEWTGDQEDEAESQAFLGQAFIGALFLMFIILLAQFNSLYNSVLVLLAVVLSTTGVLIGMLIMGQPFSIIMTGTGIVALAGIVVNNNIVLIDTYQDYSRYMPPIEAITRTAEARIRPVLLTTVTTMAGLAPMMFGLSLNFAEGGYSIDSPTALWWKQLATAVVFGLGIATVLTLVFTPSMLALRVWLSAGAYRSLSDLRALAHRRGAEARDAALGKAARKTALNELIWSDILPETDSDQPENTPETGAGEGDVAPSVADIQRVMRDTAEERDGQTDTDDGTETPENDKAPSSRSSAAE